MSRKALCVGINNYPGTGSELSGCVNDAKDWAAALKTRGYDITMLLDDKATRANIVSELTKLVRRGCPVPPLPSAARCSDRQAGVEDAAELPHSESHKEDRSVRAAQAF